MSYFAKEIFKYYLDYAKGKGVPRRIAKDTEAALRHAFERADPSQQIERVFDRVLMTVWNPVKTIKLEKQGKLPPPPKPLDPVVPVDLYEAARRSGGWDTHEKIRAEQVIQATEIKPSEGFIDWIEAAFERYFAELEQSNAEAINSDCEKSFYDKYLTSEQIWRTELVEEPEKRNIGESVDVCPAHVPIHACTRFVEAPYVPSTQFDTDLHMRTSFTNRLRGVDWSYYLQAD